MSGKKASPVLGSPPPACAHKLPCFLGGALPPPHSQPLKWFGREERRSYHQHVRRVEQRHRGLGGSGRAGNEFSPLLGVPHIGEFDRGSQRSKTRLPPFHSPSLNSNVLKYHACLGASICAFCQFGMIIRSKVLLAEPLGPLGTVNGTGPICLPASRWLASVRPGGGQHLPRHLQLFLWVRPRSSTRRDPDVTDSTWLPGWG